MKPRLALLTLDYYPDLGGVQTYLYETARRLQDSFHLIVLAPMKASSPEKIAGTIKPVHAGRAHRFLAGLLNLKPDIVLIGHAHPRLLVPAALYPRNFALITHGNDFLAAQRRWHRPLLNSLMRRARPLFTNSHHNADRLRALECPDPIVVHPGTDPQRFLPASGFRETLILLTVTRLVPRKGIDTVLRALPLVLAHFPDLEYLIAGEGPDQERLSALAAELRVENSVHFLGFVSESELPALYRSCNIFVMPSRVEEAAASIEGFGIVYLEAAASGLPVIAGRSGGAVEAVQDGANGFLVPPDDPAHLAETILTLLHDPELCSRMGQAGRAWVEREMNWDRAARQIAEALT